MSPSRDSLVDALSMKGGTGEHSYATNSHYQRDVFYEIQHVVIKSVREMLEKIGSPNCIKMADLGCSTGQNTVLAMSTIANTIMEWYQQMEETRHNGHMVLTFLGRKVSDTLSKDCFQVWSLLSDCLLDLASEGFVKESEMESFNMPFYNPNEEEVREIILKEGSFEINKIEKFDHIVPYKINREEEDDDQSFHLEAGIKHASWARCITEPLLVAHFGDAIIEPVFNKYAHYMAKYLSV